MLRKRLMTGLGLIIALSMALTACGPSFKSPGAIPSNKEGVGGYLDEIDVSVLESSVAITQIKAGAIDIYADSLASADLPKIKDAGLNYVGFNGLYYDVMYNPAVLKDATKLNPFSSRKIREATNWLYDRNYINQEVYGGGGLMKFLPIVTQFPDYADLADVARKLESKYAFNEAKATEVITAEMTGMGATQVAGKWMFKDKPVSLIFLIRPDSDGTRKPIGDYVAGQLEKVGFTVDRQYKKSSEAGPIWQSSDTTEGQWNIYTAAWSANYLNRDEKNTFQEMYLNSSLQGIEPFLSNKADPEFQKLGDDLITSKFNSLDERRTMMARALELSMQDSLQVFLIDGKNYVPYVKNVQVTADLAAGVEGAQISPFTTRFIDKEGGQLKWGAPDLFTQPWNPIAGSNWAWDQGVIRMTSSGGGDTLFDPYTGLLWPMRIEKGEVTMQDGLTVGKTLDWVTLKFEPEIKVPADAWVDWDAKTQKFITAAEAHPEGMTAKRKSVGYYPGDMKNIRWHDGSPVTMGDLIMSLIMTFDRAKKDSAIYDEQAVPNFEPFIASFKGIKIISTDPLVYEYYSDVYYQDAEVDFITGLWPNIYGFGEGGWPELAIANMAEAGGELAYSQDKSVAKEIEQTSFVGGPSLEILTKYLAKAATEGTIPFAPTMSKYVTPEEAKARYANLQAFYKDHGHYWVGTGPYYIDKVYTTEKTLVLKNNGWYPDKSDKWARFGAPKIAVVDVTNPGKVKIGSEATFDIAVNFKGAAYPQAEIKKVKYLLYNAKGDVVSVGEAKAVANGKYQVVLPADVTAKLEAGSNKLEVAVLPLPISVPTFSSVVFVTEP